MGQEGLLSINADKGERIYRIVFIISPFKTHGFKFISKELPDGTIVGIQYSGDYDIKERILINKRNLMKFKGDKKGFDNAVELISNASKAMGYSIDEIDYSFFTKAEDQVWQGEKLDTMNVKRIDKEVTNGM